MNFVYSKLIFCLLYPFTPKITFTFRILFFEKIKILLLTDVRGVNLYNGLMNGFSLFLTFSQQVSWEDMTIAIITASHPSTRFVSDEGLVSVLECSSAMSSLPTCTGH